MLATCQITIWEKLSLMARSLQSSPLQRSLVSTYLILGTLTSASAYGTSQTVEFSVVKNGPDDFILLIASVNTQPEQIHDISATAKLKVQYGDYSKELTAVVSALREVCHRERAEMHALTMNTGTKVHFERSPNSNARGLHQIVSSETITCSTFLDNATDSKPDQFRLIKRVQNIGSKISDLSSNPISGYVV